MLELLVQRTSQNSSLKKNQELEIFCPLSWNWHPITPLTLYLPIMATFLQWAVICTSVYPKGVIFKGSLSLRDPSVKGPSTRGPSQGGPSTKNLSQRDLSPRDPFTRGLFSRGPSTRNLSPRGTSPRGLSPRDLYPQGVHHQGGHCREFRLFTVLYFSIRSLRSRALRYGLPSCMSVKTT